MLLRWMCFFFVPILLFWNLYMVYVTSISPPRIGLKMALVGFKWQNQLTCIRSMWSLIHCHFQFVPSQAFGLIKWVFTYWLSKASSMQITSLTGEFQLLVFFFEGRNKIIVFFLGGWFGWDVTTWKGEDLILGESWHYPSLRLKKARLRHA